MGDVDLERAKTPAERFKRCRVQGLLGEMQDAIRSQAAKNERAVLLTECFGEVESFDRCSKDLSAWLYSRHLTLILRLFR